MSSFTPTERTQVKRLPKRGAYDRETVFKILDEGFVCHVGFVVDGQPYVIPTNYGRSGDTLYLHGSAASRMLRTLSEGIPVCVTVTLVDGLVLARSAFHHSVNYRSVVALGTARLVDDPREKREALRLFTEHIMKGRWDDIRQPSEQEMKATTVLALPLEEVSAKVRSGGPIDDEEDYALGMWAGVLPLSVTPAAPVPDLRLGSSGLYEEL
jgi:nitroimidazol reductase NimA-like FMN-containing flavoprotein (pyridoxamine 5'-phosphate oxidase superfamily)